MGGEVDAEHVTAVVLDAVRAAAGDERPKVFRDLPLGPGGVRADLAIVADEFIGVAVCGAGRSLDGLAQILAAYTRYFDRVVLALPRTLAERVRLDEGSPAAVWTVDESGLAELRPGRAGRVEISGYFDLMTIDERRRVLTELTGLDPARARGPSPASVEQVRGAFAAVAAARA